MKASEFAGQVAGILAQREGQHGPKVPNMERIAALWNAYLGPKLRRPLAASDVPALMVLMKLARAQVGDSSNPDNPLDLMGYGGIWGECLAYEAASTPAKGEGGDLAYEAAAGTPAKGEGGGLPYELVANISEKGDLTFSEPPDWAELQRLVSAGEPVFYGGLKGPGVIPAGTQISPMGVQAVEVSVEERLRAAGGHE